MGKSKGVCGFVMLVMFCVLCWDCLFGCGFCFGCLWWLSRCSPWAYSLKGQVACHVTGFRNIDIGGKG